MRYHLESGIAFYFNFHLNKRIRLLTWQPQRDAQMPLDPLWQYWINFSGQSQYRLFLEQI